MKFPSGATVAAFAAAWAAAYMSPGCAVNVPTARSTGGASGGTAGVTGGGGINVGGFGGSAQIGTCVNLQCQQDNCTRGACTQQPCPNGGKTTVSGVVYDPAQQTPLYNVVVYVPNASLADIPTGASCDTCSSPYSGRPIAATLTDASGHFTLEHMPVGDNVPAGAASTAMRQAVKDFADAGGRVFGSHWHNAWVFDGPAPWPTVAKHASGAHGFDADITVPIITTFPKGMAFADWLMNVGG